MKRDEVRESEEECGAMRLIDRATTSVLNEHKQQWNWRSSKMNSDCQVKVMATEAIKFNIRFESAGKKERIEMFA